MEDSRHKKDCYERAQYSIKYQFCTKCLHENFSVRTWFRIASSLWPFWKSIISVKLYWQFFPPYSHTPTKSNKQKMNNKTSKQFHKGQDHFHIIHSGFLSPFSIKLTFRSVRKMSCPGFFWSCCIDKSTYIYSYEIMDIQIWQTNIHIVQIYKGLTEACRNLFWLFSVNVGLDRLKHYPLWTPAVWEGHVQTSAGLPNCSKSSLAVWLSWGKVQRKMKCRKHHVKISLECQTGCLRNVSILKGHLHCQLAPVCLLGYQTKTLQVWNASLRKEHKANY